MKFETRREDFWMNWINRFFKYVIKKPDGDEIKK